MASLGKVLSEASIQMDLANGQERFPADPCDSFVPRESYKKKNGLLLGGIQDFL